MLKHFRFDIFEVQKTKLPVRLINTTNEWRLVQEHETTPLRGREEIPKDIREERPEERGGDLRAETSKDQIRDPKEIFPDQRKDDERRWRWRMNSSHFFRKIYKCHLDKVVLRSD
ncbi:hypothetical protein TNCV_191301 [Trichonephila clavipes]|nr:hypothetical protein TNCV_191301 [Trichonephila clavipes]